YIFRMLFRLTEVLTRLTSLAIIWLYNIYWVGVILLIELIFYYLLYKDGRLGIDISNVVSLLIAHPNLSFRDSYTTTRRYPTRFIGMFTLWTPIWFLV